MSVTADSRYPLISRRWLRGEEDESRPIWRQVHEHLLLRGRIASSVDLAVVELRGNIDAECAPALAQAFAELISRGATSLHVELSAIAFVDAAGLRTLGSASNAATA
jgi:hypothetical protein